MLSLLGIARRIEWYPTASRLESSYVLYTLARQHFPDDYHRILKLRHPAYVKLNLANRFPRTSVTSLALGGSARFMWQPG